MSEIRLVTTKEAAKATNLSEFELRRGWKIGRYPALAIGGDTGTGRGSRLRWNVELLQKAIAEEMNTTQKSN